MAKKIYMKNVSKEVVDTINSILEVTFTNAFERKELSKENAQLKKSLEEAKAMETLGDTPKMSSVDIQKKMNIIKSKQECLRKWTDTTLRTHKNNKDEWEDGLFASLGVNKELAETYVECRANCTWGKWNEAIRKVLINTFEMSLDDKLVAKFASYLEHCVGDSPAGINQVLKGQLLKPATVRNFNEVMVRAIATYMAKTNDSVVIPTTEFYTATVKYDKNLRNVESFSVNDKRDIEEESANTDTENTTDTTVSTDTNSVDYSALSYRELQTLCKERGISAKGNAETLRAKLVA